jgi:uncharacterized membrane protein
MKRARSLLLGATLLVLTVAPALPAQARSFWMGAADVEVVVQPDGSLHVIETLSIDFTGSYSGSYRDIRVRRGETVTVLTVADESGAMQPGGCTTLGCSSPAGTYGVTSVSGAERVVWHHSSRDQRRVFTITYVMTGVATAYDDVVDVNLQVWGDQWAVGVSRLTARIVIPTGANPGEVKVWGHPSTVSGSTSLGDDLVSPSLQASGVPPNQWVELRTTFPTALLANTAGARVRAGEGLQAILEEEARFFQDAEQAARAVRLGLIWGSGLALLIAFGIGGFVYLRYGREPRIDYDRQYEQEPPTELTPAEVGALLSQGAVTEREFTATLFDLIRQGAITATPSQVERSTWGGLRREMISDLVLAEGPDRTGLRDFEQSVLTVVKRVLGGQSRPLHEFRQRIRDDANANAQSYQTFRTRVVKAVKKAHLLDVRGKTVTVVALMLVAGMVFVAMMGLPPLLGRRPGGEVTVVLVIAGMVFGALALFVFLMFRKVRVKRTPEGAMEAARWSAFRRYLRDFSRLEEAPVISLDLWDRYLIYAIAFGVAEEVLEKARLSAPPELEQRSSIYWFGTYGYSGGHTENAFAGLTSALSGAFSPPSSGSSGGGGGFGGGGGGGRGGGGGGSW